MIVIPAWLKTDPVACYVPDRTIFQPQRRIIRLNGQPYLLDMCERRYPLAHCDRLRLEHLDGVALWITAGQPLTLFRLASPGYVIAITDGTRKAFVQFHPERRAAERLAAFFDGEVITSV